MLHDRLTKRHEHDGSLVSCLTVTANSQAITVQAEYVDGSTIEADLEPSLGAWCLYRSAKAIVDHGVSETISVEAKRIQRERDKYAGDEWA